ncbi:MAG: Ribonuclease/mRNA interferase VapC [Thermodesulfobacterium sp.]|uniref:Ribonuclease/mRNA interferase VapC n=1 Tax=Candidatus Thermodesulfobacterium syntrophicum TaxID=3060442 RepID=A0AAE3P3W8_9BACT|nr:Ribonuclease/mRNA interferase VapC [Candidatus Thermodesulfobacterium syntrophicum]
MIYLLDTNIIAYLIKHKDLKLFNKFEEIAKKHQIGISSITYAEICHGLEKKNSEKLKIKVLPFLEVFKIYPFDEKAAFEYGKIRAQLEREGNLIGVLDMLIAAHAKSLNAILITNNEKEFKKVKGLAVENWCKN